MAEVSDRSTKTDIIWVLQRFFVFIELSTFVYFIGPASARSYKIGGVGNNWLVGNAIFAEKALRIFLIFSMRLGECKGRKVTESDFQIFAKRAPNWPKIKYFDIFL